MKQEQFIQQHQATWDVLQQWLTYLHTSKRQRKKQQLQQPTLDFAQTYRQVCHHLALAQSRKYSPILIERLNELVVDGHRQLYTSRFFFLHSLANFLLRDFPMQVRAEWRLIMLAALLFFGSLVGMIITLQIVPDMVYSVISIEQVSEIEDMYDPAIKSRFGREREADSDVLMFGFYIRNNTSIGFQVFASGLLFGVGTLFMLLYNGIVIGAVAGHLTHIGFTETFWGFVAGHSAFELSAIVLSAAAGLKLAAALIAPGRKTRRLALSDNSKVAIKIMYGAALLFFMAAFVEAFWSSMATIPFALKITVGLSLWALLLGYFIFSARGHTVKD